MDRLRRIFGQQNMTWKRVLLLSLISAVITAAAAAIPALDDTSFEDISVNLDVWFFLAVYIVVNCATVWEAAAKCFVFFLLSQPLVYLLQVPFSPLGWGLFQYYPHWFRITLLTLPGAAVAFLLKKKDWLSAAVLSVATGYLAVAAVRYFILVRMRFPRHGLSLLFCLIGAVLLILVLLPEKKHRTAALAVFAAALLGFGAWRSTRIVSRVELPFPGADCVCTIGDPSLFRTETGEEGIVLKARRDGNTLLTLEAADGSTAEYHITVYGGSILVSRLDDGE